MKLNFLAFAVPLFIGLMYAEYLFAKKRKRPYGDLHSSISNISIGIAERLSDVLITGFFYFIYDHLQRRYGLFHIRPTIFLWILLLLATDFLWYWYHRLAHEINVLWAVHVVHHQSDDFNYTVSARITVLQALVRTCFWAVLPVLGFPAPMITTMLLVHGLYPFFVHTKEIGKLGVLEYILVTPSHHRVHHASNEPYLDKNYGDVFIIWDKLFGTFQKEAETPVYGLVHPLKTYSFLWQHFHYFFEIGIAMKEQSTWAGKIKMLFLRPAKMNDGYRSKAEVLMNIQHNPQAIQKPLNHYVVWQMALMLAALFFFILFERTLPALFCISFTVFTLLTLINCGAIMEQKKWVFDLELARFTLVLLTLTFYPTGFTRALIVLLLTLIVVVLALRYYRSLKDLYLSIVYNNSGREQPH